METALKLVTAATDTPVSTTEAKLHLKVEHTTDDTLILMLIKAATTTVEAYTNRVLQPTTFDLQVHDLNKDEILLPVSPVTSLTSVKHYDSDNVEQTFDTGNFYYSINNEPTEIEFTTLPTYYSDRFDQVTIRFVAGYTTCPDALKQAVLLLVGDMYENRTDQPRERFTAWKQLAYPYKLFY